MKKIRFFVAGLATASAVLGCVSAERQAEYAAWLASEDGVETVKFTEFESTYRQGWRARAEQKRAAKSAREEQERRDRLAAEEYAAWLKSEDGRPSVGQAEFERDYRSGWIERVKSRRYHKSLVASVSEVCLARVRTEYARGRKSTCPYPRQNADDDWVKNWLGPRLDISDDDYKAGVALLSDFGERYLPDLQAAYDRAKEQAEELQQVFNEEFPTPWKIAVGSPRRKAFDALLKKLSDARAEYFVCHDELCACWLAWRLGRVSTEDLSRLDIMRVMPKLDEGSSSPYPRARAVRTLPADLKTFAMKYAPDEYELYLKLEQEQSDRKKLLDDVRVEMLQLDIPRPDRSMRAFIEVRNEVVDEMNEMAKRLEAWRSEYKTQLVSAQEVADQDRKQAQRLKTLLRSLPSRLEKLAQ